MRRCWPQCRPPKSSKKTGGLLLAADVAPCQCLREGPAGKTGKQKNKKSTFKAGMCMKTNKTRTKCPEKVGHLRLRFGHFRLTDMNFAEIRGEFTVSRRKYRACGLGRRLERSESENPGHKYRDSRRGRGNVARASRPCAVMAGTAMPQVARAGRPRYKLRALLRARALTPARARFYTENSG